MNVIDVSNISTPGGIFASSITPLNPVLFPNLVGIAQHYREYKFRKLVLHITPQVSKFAQGSYAVTTVLPG